MAQSAEGVKFNTVKRMSVWVSDGSGELEMVFFKGIKWMHEKLKPGLEFIFFGKPTVFGNRINIVHPEVDAVTADKLQMAGAGARMTGVYPSTEKLKNGGITGKVMTKQDDTALTKALGDFEETLP